MTRFDLPYPAAAPGGGSGGDEPPARRGGSGGAETGGAGVFDVELDPPPELDPESTGIVRRPRAFDEPEDAA